MAVKIKSKKERLKRIMRNTDAAQRTDRNTFGNQMSRAADPALRGTRTEDLARELSRRRAAIRKRARARNKNK